MLDLVFRETYDNKYIKLTQEGAMKRCIFMGVVLCFILSGSSCATISSQAEKVNLHSSMSTILDDCKKLGPVSAEESAWGHFSMSDTYQQAKNNLREEAFKIYNADTVVLINVDEYATKIIAHGVAFNCFSGKN